MERKILKQLEWQEKQKEKDREVELEARIAAQNAKKKPRLN